MRIEQPREPAMRENLQSILAVNRLPGTLANVMIAESPTCLLVPVRVRLVGGDGFNDFVPTTHT
jgi:hypothetical protein